MGDARITAEAIFDTHVTALGLPERNATKLDPTTSARIAKIGETPGRRKLRAVSRAAAAAATIADHANVLRTGSSRRGSTSRPTSAPEVAGNRSHAVLEVISGHIANVATLTNLTMNTGDSLNVRSFDDRTSGRGCSTRGRS
jgi:hypothetical protein